MKKSVNTRTVYKIIGSDYSAQEPRLTTFLSGAKKMYDAYNNGKDLYAIIAQSAFHNNYDENLEFYPAGTEIEVDGQKVITGKKTHLNKAGKERRATGKVLNLATCYGMSGRTAGIRLGYKGKDAKIQGEKLLDDFFTDFPEVKATIEASKAFLRVNGYVEDIVGRRRRLSDINLPPYEAKLKAQTIEEANFNPFLICGDRCREDDPEIIWDMLIKAYVILSNAYQLSKDSSYKVDREMSSQKFDFLKKLAQNPSYVLQELVDKDSAWDRRTNAQKIVDDMQVFKNILTTGRYKQGRKIDVQFVDDEEHTEFFKLIKEYKRLYGDNVVEKIPVDAMNLQAWTGRIAQASRQCLNARIQGCLSADSTICTKNGLVTIGSLSNTAVEVWDGKDYTTAVVLPSGLKQKCILTTGTGNTVTCSPDHKFLTINVAGHTSFKKLSELKKQDRLIYTQEMPVFSHNLSLKQLTKDYLTTDKVAYNRHDYSFEDIQNKYIRGQLLGRIASDGSYIRQSDGSGYIYILVAEHELELLDNFIYPNIQMWHYNTRITQKKNQKVYQVIISSRSLADECYALDIKHSLHDYFMKDSELLRGFISGFFDGNGCSATSNHNINLVFGKQADFTNIVNQMSLALHMLGIRNTARFYKDRYRIDIKRADSQLFANRIGFITSKKQLEALNKRTVKENRCWGDYLVDTIKSIEITNDYIEMFDVCNTQRGYFVANGLVTHNSAASLTKIAMIDINNDPRLIAMDTHLIITVHDEVLVECPAVYADEVEKLLPEIMIKAAAKIGDDVPQACDPYNVSRWYSDTAGAFIQEEFKKLENGDKDKNIAPLPRDKALAKVIKNHSEVPQESIIKTIETGCDLEF